MPGFHLGMRSSGMIAPFHLNSVGPPQPTPAICPTQPAFILSTYSATGSRRTFCCADALTQAPATTHAATPTSPARRNMTLSWTNADHLPDTRASAAPECH